MVLAGLAVSQGNFLDFISTILDLQETGQPIPFFSLNFPKCPSHLDRQDSMVIVTLAIDVFALLQLYKLGRAQKTQIFYKLGIQFTCNNISRIILPFKMY